MRVPGRQPLFQAWFDLQPVSFGGDVTFEGLEEVSIEGEVRFAMRSMFSTERSATFQASSSVIIQQHPF